VKCEHVFSWRLAWLAFAGEGEFKTKGLFKLEPPAALTAHSFCFHTSSVILPLLASVRHSARSQCIANLVSNAVQSSRIFEAVNYDGI
jgi:hypothetical protein